VTVTPTLSDILATARVVSLPMRARFRGLTHREALLFEGENGWAEWSPFFEYDDDEARIWLQAAMDQGFGLKREVGEVRLNATLPAVNGEDIAHVLSMFQDTDTIKIKVAEAGQSIEQDLERIASVRKLKPESALRLDANGGYTVEEAMKVAEAAGVLDYFEQPCATIGELAELRARLRGATRIAADESVRKVEDPMAVVYAGAADVLVLKAQPLGGVTRALEIARECGLPVTVSSALETPIGIQAGLAFATALGGDAAHGLGTLSLFESTDVFNNEALASEERRDWWLERLARCYRLI
jgi:O-succinylbenzoate synthase